MKNRASTIEGLLQNYEIIDEVINAAENAEGSALKENEKYLESLEGKMNQLTNAIQEFWHVILDSGVVGQVLDFLTNTVNLVTDLVEKFGLLPTLAGGISIFFGGLYKIVGLFDKKQGIFENMKDYLSDQSIKNLKITAKNLTSLTSGWSSLTSVINLCWQALKKWFLKFNPAIKGIMLAVSALAGAFALWYDANHTSESELLESSKEAKESIDEINRAFNEGQKIITKYYSSFEKLSKGVDVSTNTNLSLSEKEYEEYLNICNEIAEAYPQLKKGTDENGNAILDLGNDSHNAANKLKEFLNTQEDIKNVELSNHLTDLFNGIDVEINNANNSLLIFKNNINDLKKDLGIVEDVLNNGLTISDDGFLYFDTEKEADLGKKVFEDLYENADKDLKKKLNQKSYDVFNNNKLYIGADDELFNAFNKQIQVEANKESNRISSQIVQQEAEIANAEVIKYKFKDSLTSLNDAMTSMGTYKSLDETSQKIASSFVLSLDESIRSELTEGNWENYIYENVLIPLSEVSAEDQAKLNETYAELFKLNPNDLSDENKNNIQLLINEISSIIGKDPIEIRTALGFDIDKDFEKSYKNSIDKTIEKFEDLSSDKVQNLYSYLGIDSQDEIAKWNEIVQNVDSAKEAIKEYKELTSTSTSEQMISQINGLSDGFEHLDKIMKSIQSEDPFDYTLLADDAMAEFKEFGGDAYTEFYETISANPKDLKKCQDAFNNLATAWMDGKYALEGLSDETAQLSIDMLKNMGIVNAEEVVYSRLAVQKASVIAETEDLSNITLEEIDNLAEENGVVGEATESWRAYFAQKMLDYVYNGQGSIAQLAKIVEALGIATETWNTYWAAVRGEGAFEINRNDYKNGGKKVLVSEGTEEVYEVETYSEAQVERNKLLPELQKAALKSAELRINKLLEEGSSGEYGGGPKTNDPGSDSSKDDYKETFDFFERRVDVLQQAFDGLSASMENVFGADAKNTILGAQAGILAEEVNNYTDALAMYSEMADRSLAGLDESLQEKIKNGAVELTDFTGENGEAVVKAMEAYKGWSDKINDCSVKLENLKKELAQLELQKFNNIVDDYTNQFDLYGNSIDLIDKQIGLFEEAGQLIGEAFYQGQIDLSEKQLDTLYSEKSKLANQLNEALSSGNVEVGSDEWLEMVKTMSDLDGQILETKTSIEQFNNAILQIEWDTFERIQTQFGYMESDLQNLVDLFSDFTDIEVSDGHGTWTDEAIASLGIYAQQYEMAKYQVEQYAEAIEKLKDDYSEGKYSATEYAEKLAELNSGQWEAVKSAESMEDAIMDLNRTRVDEEIEVINEAIEAYREYTDSQKEALEAARDLHEYEESIAEKTKSVTDLEKRLAAMQNDNTAATIAKRKQLEEELAEAKKDLEETEYDHSVDTQLDALEKNYENYEEKRNAEIEALEESLKNREAIISQSFETVKQNAELVGQEMLAIAEQHGVQLSTLLTDCWFTGENAVASYGDTLNVKSSAFILDLQNVETEAWNLQEKANTTAESLTNMFATQADNLVVEFNEACTSEQNLDDVTVALQQHLIELLERGYDISGITSALDSIASGADSVSSAAKGASSALDKLIAKQEELDELEDKDKDITPTKTTAARYKIVSVQTGETLEDNLTLEEATHHFNHAPNADAIMKIVRMKKGGIVKKDYSSILDPIAQTVGEDRMIAVKDGEGILTKEQTKGLLKIAPVFSNGLLSWLSDTKIPTNNIERPQQSISYQYGSLVTVNGNIDDTNINKMTEIVRKELKNTFSKIDRDHRYSGY